MAQVTWSPSALLDVESVAEFISRDSSHYAALFVQKLLAHVEKMGQFPNSGRVVPEYQLEHLREFIYENYRVVYRTKESGIEVAAVVHGMKRLPESPP